MKVTTTKNIHMHTLKTGKIKGPNPLERLYLKTVGWVDGSKGLPRLDTDGNWLSPHIARELRSFHEFCSYQWGRLQIEKAADYAHLADLMDTFQHYKLELETAIQDLEKATEAEMPHLEPIRQTGEEQLSNDQVCARRANEVRKRLAPLEVHVDDLQDKLQSLTRECSALHKQILEENNSVRLVCKRVEDHLKQRLTVYWNSALRRHPEGNTMPAAPNISLVCNAEDLYLRPHQALLHQAELVTQQLTKEV